MAGRTHRYDVMVGWTGNRGTGTRSYGGYDRSHVIRAEGRPDITGSSDPAFRGDPAHWTPEHLLVASLSACHKLWYLHLCAEAGVCVIAYVDRAVGMMAEETDGSGQFTRVVLRPEVTLAAGADRSRAIALHNDAHQKCFIARSMNFPVTHEPSIIP